METLPSDHLSPSSFPSVDFCAKTQNFKNQIDLAQILSGFLGLCDQGLGGMENAVHVMSKSFMTHDMEVGKFLKERWGAIINVKVKGDKKNQKMLSVIVMLVMDKSGCEQAISNILR